MTSQLKAKLLQHFAGKKKANGGFTLIELLVVIIIIGILSAIALPSFLNQANKAKQSEAKTYIGSMNRAQQAYFMENGKMAPQERIAQLGLGIETETNNYKYSISANSTDSFVLQRAEPVSTSLKAYAGGVETSTVGSGGNVEATTVAKLCEAILPPVGNGPDGTSDAVATYFVGLDGVKGATEFDCKVDTFKNLGA
ncbi:MAG: type IV pilin-like G/H family protein [Phormidesmis sp.]